MRALDGSPPGPPRRGRRAAPLPGCRSSGLGRASPPRAASPQHGPSVPERDSAPGRPVAAFLSVSPGRDQRRPTPGRLWGPGPPRLLRRCCGPARGDESRRLAISRDPPQKRGRKGEKTRSFGCCPERCRVSREICHALTATKLDPPRGAKHNTGRQNRRPFPGVLSPCPRRGWPWGDRSPRRGVGGGSGSLPWPGTRCGDRLCWRLLRQGLEITQRLLGGLLGSR